MIDQNRPSGNVRKADVIKHKESTAHQSDSLKAKLTVIRGEKIGHVYLLELGVNLFGRVEGNILYDILASRRHMQIEIIDRDIILADLDSTNGTFLNGKEVSDPTALKHGDVILVGETILVFELEGKDRAVVGFGAAPQRSIDLGDDDITIQIRKKDLDIQE